LQTKPGSSLVESPDSPELEIFKVQSEAALKLRAEYLYLRGIENLFVSRKYEQARNLFEEAMKMREDKL
jgi:glutamine synthetase adenylyltransferase